MDVILRITDEQKRLDVFLRHIEQSNIETLLCIATLINMFELAQGRLAGDHIKEDEIVFSVENLSEIEALYSSKVREGLKEYNILDSKDYQIGSYIWKSLDGDNYAAYMRNLLTTDQNRLLYIARAAQISNSSRDGLTWFFRLQEDFQDFLTVEQAKETISQAINTKELFRLPPELQNRIAAFEIFSAGLFNDFGTVSDTHAQQWIVSIATN